MMIFVPARGTTYIPRFIAKIILVMTPCLYGIIQSFMQVWYLYERTVFLCC